MTSATGVGKSVTELTITVFVTATSPVNEICTAPLLADTAAPGPATMLRMVGESANGSFKTATPPTPTWKLCLTSMPLPRLRATSTPGPLSRPLTLAAPVNCSSTGIAPAPPTGVNAVSVAPAKKLSMLCFLFVPLITASTVAEPSKGVVPWSLKLLFCTPNPPMFWKWGSFGSWDIRCHPLTIWGRSVPSESGLLCQGRNAYQKNR